VRGLWRPKANISQSSRLAFHDVASLCRRLGTVRDDDIVAADCIGSTGITGAATRSSDVDVVVVVVKDTVNRPNMEKRWLASKVKWLGARVAC